LYYFDDACINKYWIY